MLRKASIILALFFGATNLVHANQRLVCESANHTVALKVCSDLIAENPRDARAYIGRAFAYAGLRQWDRAISDATIAVELNPKDPSAYHVRGRVYWQKGDYDNAIADLTLAIEYTPSRADARSLTHRGVAYLSKGDQERALSVCPMRC